MAYNPRRARPGDEITATMWNDLQDELRRLGRVRVSGGLSMYMGPGGLAIGLAETQVVFRAVSTSIITARATSTLGQGTAKLRDRAVATLTDGVTGLVVYSDFSTAVASGKAIIIARDGEAYLLVAADCP